MSSQHLLQQFSPSAQPAVAPNATYDPGLQVDQSQWPKEVVETTTTAAPPLSQLSTSYYPYAVAADSEAAKIAREPRVNGSRRTNFILACILAFLLALVVVMAGVFGSKLAGLESTQKKFSEQLASTNSNFTSPTTTTGGPNGGTPTIPSAAATTSITIQGWTYVGCFSDDTNRALADAQQTTEALLNSNCASFCQKYEYFGTEFGDQCYCANAPELKPAPSWNCNNHCNGATSTSEICGGYFYLSVWKKS